MSNFTKHLRLSYSTKDETMQMETFGGIELETGLNMLLLGIVQITNQLLAAVPDTHKQAMRENIHDRLNQSFYGILTELIPEDEVPDLTSFSIIDAQNKALDDARNMGLSIEEYLEAKKREFLTPHEDA